jgi:hypothetical protein
VAPSTLLGKIIKSVDVRRSPEEERGSSILSVRVHVISAIRFLWNATSGSRLRPWRSEYLKWRIETYSGMKAESITPVEMFHFAWREKWNLLHFLRWAGKLEKQAVSGRD